MIPSLCIIPDRERKEDGLRLFLLVSGDGTRGNRHNLKHRKFHLNVKNFFTVMVTGHQNRETVESPSLEVFETHPGTALSNLP